MEMQGLMPYVIVGLTGLTVLSVGFAVGGDRQRQSPLGDTILASQRVTLIAQAAGVSPGMAMLSYGLLQFLAPLLLFLWRPPLAIMGFVFVAIAFVLAPVWAPQMIRNRSLKKFESQLPPFTDQLVASVRGDLPLLVSLQEVTSALQDPLRSEIAMLAEQANKGQGGIDAAIVNARRRYTSRNYSLLLSIIHIFSRQGGNLIEPMQNMSRSFKEIYRLEAKIQTAVASARATFWVVNLGLLLIVLFVSIGQPQLIDQIFETAAGIGLFLLGLILYGIGTYWLLAMTKVEV